MHCHQPCSPFVLKPLFLYLSERHDCAAAARQPAQKPYIPPRLKPSGWNWPMDGTCAATVVWEEQKLRLASGVQVCKCWAG